MSHTEICEEVVVAAPIKDVWEFYTDHCGWPQWNAAGSVTLEKEGSPDKNGTGCIRAITTAAIFTVREEILSFDAPHRMTYTVLSGIPMSDHSGEVLFEECDLPVAEGEATSSSPKRGTRIVWRARFVVTWGFAWCMVPVTRKFFRDALDALARILGERHAQK
eukprot:Opistho-1_new@103166